MKFPRRAALPMALGFAAALTAACAWLPPQIEPAALTTQAPISVTDIASDGHWPEAQWWKKYGDPDLDGLIEQALQQAPSLTTAEARFTSARESVRLAAAASGLNVAAQGDVTRQRLSDNGLISPRFVGFNWYNQADLGIRATYSFDWWHKLDATTRAAVSEARAAQAERSAASLTLTAAIADSYFGWQADAAQLALMNEQLSLSQQRRDITAARVRAGIESDDQLSNADVELANGRETIVALQYSGTLRRVALAALIGVDAAQLPPFNVRPLPQVSAQLPDNVRIDLLSRRADITASYWRVSAAQQQLKVARAEFLPDISINALASLSSIDLGKLLETGSAAPSLGAAIHLPIFDSGRLHALYGARAAMLNGAISNYNDTVLKAAREVAVQVTTLQRVAAQRAERHQQSAASAQLVNTASARARQGLIDERPVLSARQAAQQQRSALLNLDASAISADINLVLALGGGYVASAAEQDELRTSSISASHSASKNASSSASSAVPVNTTQQKVTF